VAGSFDDDRRRRMTPKTYPHFLPGLTLDYLWIITEQNDLHRWLLEPLRLKQPVIDRHFFELLLDPTFRRYQEEHHDWQAVVTQAIRCFAGQTLLFTRPNNAEHAAYKAVMHRLRTSLPGFTELEELAYTQAPTIEAGAREGSLCGEGEVVLPWTVDWMLPLAFSAIFRRDIPTRTRSAWKSPFQVTLAPMTDALAVAATLVYFDRSGWAHEAAQTNHHAQLRWGLALIETLIAAGNVGADEPAWEPLGAFQALHHKITEHFPTPAEAATRELTGHLIAAIRDLWNHMASPDRENSLAFIRKFCQNEGLTYLTKVFMSKEVNPLYVGTTLEYRPDNRERLQAGLERADATLPEELREEHPSRPLKEINEVYPNQWIALQPTRVGPGLGILEGRVFGVEADRDPVENRLDELRQEFPSLSLYAHFTGPASSARAARRG
jgi:hypothetical protein